MAIQFTHPSIEIFKEIGQDSYTIYLSGELDASNSLVVDDALQKAVKAHKKTVWVDFEHLNYISSTGLGMFLSHYLAFKQKGISLVLFNMSPKIRSVFQVLGLEEVMLIADDQEQALSLLRQRA
jgi:anti-sigma B factor antagonist